MIPGIFPMRSDNSHLRIVLKLIKKLTAVSAGRLRGGNCTQILCTLMPGMQDRRLFGMNGLIQGLMLKFDVGPQEKIRRIAFVSGTGHDNRTDLKARNRCHCVYFCQRQQARHELFQIDFQTIDQLSALPGKKPAGLPGYALQNTMDKFWKFKQLRLELFLAVGHHQLDSSTLFVETLAYKSLGGSTCRSPIVYAFRNFALAGSNFCLSPSE